MAFRPEEEHARRLLSGELGTTFRHHDDGSSPRMPDLLSSDGMHVAEVITTAPPAVRKAQNHLDPVSDLNLPHCVRVAIPYTNLGQLTKIVRGKLRADIVQRVQHAGCVYHWSSRDELRLLPGIDPIPILGLMAYSDGVQVMCVQRCQHSDLEPHQVVWSVMHEPSPNDPWSLIRQSLLIVEEEQHGGIQALAEKLKGYPNQHLVMYPFGQPGNLTAAIGSYVPPLNLRDLVPRELHPTLSSAHLWLLYKYGHNDATEGLHTCNGHWARFGTKLPNLADQAAPVRHFHYRDS